MYTNIGNGNDGTHVLVEMLHSCTPKASLLAAIHPNTIVANDGNGIVTSVNIKATKPLECVKFTRLADIDASEWEAIHFIRVVLPSGDNVQLNRFLNHYSMSSLYYMFLMMELVDSYTMNCHGKDFKFQLVLSTGRISHYWIRWLTVQTHNQLVLLDKLASLDDGSSSRSRFMSHHGPRQTSEDQPFLISLNTTLVLMGFAFVFTTYCCDKNLIAQSRRDLA